MLRRLLGRFFRKRIPPGDVEVLFNEGFDYKQKGELNKAIQIYNRILEVDENNEYAHHFVGRLFGQLGDASKAIYHLEKALSIQPGLSDAYCDLGNVYNGQKMYKDAIQNYMRSISQSPDNALAYNNLGLAFKSIDNMKKAVDNLNKAINIKPDFYFSYFNLGLIEADQGHYDNARDYFQLALHYNENYSEAYYNLGLTLQHQGKYQDAESHIRNAVTLDPDFVNARSNLGVILSDQGKYEEAIQCYQEVLNQEPDNDEALWNFANTRLVSGNFVQGWKDYEKRWERRAAVKRPFEYPVWEGESLDGCMLLIYGEQGLGDEIMFSSCIPDILARGGCCILECDPRLAPLFTRSFPEVQVHGRKDLEDTSWLSAAEPIDAQIPIGSLPQYFRRSLDDFPERTGYLTADHDRVTYWKHRLESLGPGLKIGISWQGGVITSRQTLRSIGLENWLPVLKVPGIEFISLQYTDCQDEIAVLEAMHGIKVQHWQEAIDDYDETAALVSALDLVVSVCTSVVSLGGALGKPVWVMVPSSPGWIFMREGERMPWFPSVKIFRQEKPMEWEPVIQRVVEALETRRDA